MLRSKNIDRICCLVIACTMLLAAGFTALAGAGVLESSRKTSLTYAKHLFDQSIKSKSPWTVGMILSITAQMKNTVPVR